MIFLWPFVSMGQTIKPLTIGDRVPDVEIKNVYNYPASTIHLSGLKAKLVILDFWATWCGSCLNAFPEMHDLKKKFGDQLQILFVNSFSADDEIKVKRTFNKLEERTGRTVELPYILKDTLLSLYFPHTYVPHYVWLGSNSQVLAITHREAVTEKNIRAYLNGDNPTLLMKDDALAFNSQIPLLVDGNGGAPADFLYRSILTAYKDNLGETGGYKRDANGHITRIYLINYTILSLLKEAWPEIRNYKPCRIICDVPHPEKFKSFRDREKAKEYSFCYELICPPASQKKLQEYLQSDFRKFFNAVVKVEERNVDGYVLKANSGIKNIFSKSDSSYSGIAENIMNKRMRKQPVKKLAGMLEDILDKPVIDETEVLQNIDLDFPHDIFSYDLESLNAFLQKNGFDLIPSKRKISVAVISEDR